MSSRPKKTQPRPASRFCLITPAITDPAGFSAALQTACAAGDIAAVLLRLAAADERTLINRAKLLAPVAQAARAAVLLDGHADLVARAGADGAHLSGLSDFDAARAHLKPDRIAGVGALASRHDAMLAAEGGADYVMFGGADADPTATHERIAWWAEVFEIPCIGFAAHRAEAATLAAAGADFVALGFVFNDARGPAAALTEAAQDLLLLETTP